MVLEHEREAAFLSKLGNPDPRQHPYDEYRPKAELAAQLALGVVGVGCAGGVGVGDGGDVEDAG